MHDTTVSVVIPAFNQAEFLGDAVRSALEQTCGGVAVIAVDDASTDGTARLLRQFDDPRLRVIAHETNRGLSAARNSGIRSSSGDLIAFLDADDFFHQDKLALHLEFLRAHPEVGVTYNARFELNHSARTIRELWRPPASCGLAALLPGFPFAPSDMVVRRTWLSRVGLFDENLRHFSEDLDINCRLALAGCRFASVDRALNFRRYHTGRTLRLRERLAAALSVIDRVVADPRCPAEVAAARDGARAAHYLVWGFHAFLQNDAASGREFLTRATKLDPTYLANGGDRLVESLLYHCMADENIDHGRLLMKIVEQLPPGFPVLQRTWEDAAAQGYLRRAAAAAMWSREEDAARLFSRAQECRARASRRAISAMATHLLNIADLVDPEAAAAAVERIAATGRRACGPVVRELSACYFLNRAFRQYGAGAYREVIRSVRKAITAYPRYGTNRGLLSIGARSGWRVMAFSRTQSDAAGR